MKSAVTFQKFKFVSVLSVALVPLFIAGCTGSYRGLPPLREVALLAGAIDPGGRGDIDGAGNAARLSSPEGLAVDGKGGLVFVDAGNRKLKRVSADGVVSTVANLANFPARSDEAGREIQADAPGQVAIGPDGHYYVAASQILWPGPRASLPPGSASLAQTWVVLDVSPDGTVTVFADPLQGAGTETSAGSDARALAFDSRGRLYVADIASCAIRRIDETGAISTLLVVAAAPGRDRCGGFDSIKNGVAWLAVDAQDGIAYGLADGRVRYRGPDGSDVAWPATTGVSWAGGGATFDRTGRLIVAEATQRTVSMLTPGGAAAVLAGATAQSGYFDGSAAEARFALPVGVAVGPDGRIFVTDREDHTIRLIGTDGRVSTLAGLAPQAAYRDGQGAEARFSENFQLTGDAFGAVYVADSSNRTIRKIDPSGEVSTIAGVSGPFSAAKDGVGAEARFGFPQAIAATPDGTLYVFDSPSLRQVTRLEAVESLPQVPGLGTGVQFAAMGVGDLLLSSGDIAIPLFQGPAFSTFQLRRRTLSGELITLLDSNTTEQPALRAATAKGLLPQGVAADSEGRIYFTLGHAVFRRAADGAVTVLAGALDQSGHGDSRGDAARFASPQGLAVDDGGFVYVADSGNHVVRRVTPQGQVSTVLGQPGRAGIVLGDAPGGLDTPTAVALSPNGLIIKSRLAILVARP